jgi:hypothetical protein
MTIFHLDGPAIPLDLVSMFELNLLPKTLVYVYLICAEVYGDGK